MHRTVGNAYIEIVVESQTIRVSQDETGVEGEYGTEFYAGLVNSMQEEICRVVEYAGLTLYADDVADKAGAWGQLRDAIFDSEMIDTAALTDGAVTDAKVSDVSIDKLTAGQVTDLSYVIGSYTNYLSMGVEDFFEKRRKHTADTYPLTFSKWDYGYIYFWHGETDSTHTFANQITYDELQFYDNEYVDSYTRNTVINARSFYTKYEDVDYPTSGQTITTAVNQASGYERIVYDSGSQIGKAKLNADGLWFKDSNMSIRHTVINFGTSGWTEDPPASGIYIKNVATTIPPAAHILGAFWTSKSFSSPIYTVDAFTEGMVNYIQFQAGATYTAYMSVDYDPGDSGYTEHYLTILYSHDVE